MRKHLEEISGRDFYLSLLFENPTIESLASALEQWQQDPEKWASLVKIKDGDGSFPLFCCHPIEGNAIWYMEMARELPSWQKVYGLEAPGMDKLQFPLFTMEDLAAFHIKEMKKVQPHGPYFLTGYSFGGLLAFEVARQLECSGDNVGLLAIIDRSKPAAAPKIAGGAICPAELACERGFSFSDRFHSHWYWTNKWIRMEFRKSLAFFMRIFNPRIPFMRKIMRDVSYFMMMLYQPASVYNGDMLLLRQEPEKRPSNRQAERYYREDYGWSDYVCGKIQIRHIPGEDHQGLMSRPYAAIISSMMEEAIEEARGRCCLESDQRE